MKQLVITYKSSARAESKSQGIKYTKRTDLGNTKMSKRKSKKVLDKVKTM